MNIINRDSRVKNSKKWQTPKEIQESRVATALVTNVLKKYELPSIEEAKIICNELAIKFPDDVAPDSFWTDADDKGFKDFFVWGHDHVFFDGIERKGAMGKRHVEIVSELMQFDMFPSSLAGSKILNVGCWTGGDQLILNGLGAETFAVEEHPVAARAFQELFSLLSVDSIMLGHSLYMDDQKYRCFFDHIYCSGVIYHVTDPLLFLRILFAYLRKDGTLMLETKSSASEDSVLRYSGTCERGWNWYAPNEEVLFRWLVDAGFSAENIKIHRRDNGRLLASAVKDDLHALPESSGFSRPGSWLEGVC